MLMVLGFGHTCSIWKFPGWGSNLNCSCARPLHWAGDQTRASADSAGVFTRGAAAGAPFFSLTSLKSGRRAVWCQFRPCGRVTESRVPSHDGVYLKTLNGVPPLCCIEGPCCLLKLFGLGLACLVCVHVEVSLFLMELGSHRVCQLTCGVFHLVRCALLDVVEYFSKSVIVLCYTGLLYLISWLLDVVVSSVSLTSVSG